jgi:hypothetical protein
MIVTQSRPNQQTCPEKSRTGGKDLGILTTHSYLATLRLQTAARLDLDKVEQAQGPTGPNERRGADRLYFGPIPFKENLGRGDAFGASLLLQLLQEITLT